MQLYLLDALILLYSVMEDDILVYSEIKSIYLARQLSLSGQENCLEFYSKTNQMLIIF